MAKLRSVVIAFFLIATGLFLSGTPVMANGDSAGGGSGPELKIPFGGPIIKAIPCSKPPGMLLTIGPPSPRPVMVIFKTTLVFLFGSFRPGAFVLGIAGTKPSPCVTGLVPTGAGVVADIIGTSL